MVFTCDRDGCGRTYQRKEHLNRHLKDHEAVRSFICPTCEAKFSRGDTLRRHMSLHGPRASAPLPARVAQACEICHRNKTRCDGARPSCSPCSEKGRKCRYSSRSATGSDALDQPTGRPQTHMPSCGSTTGMELDAPPLFQQRHLQQQMALDTEGYKPLATAIAGMPPTPLSAVPSEPEPQMDPLVMAATAWETGIMCPILGQLYFENFHPHWPLLHRHSFEQSLQIKPLAQAVMNIGLFYSNSLPATRALVDEQHAELLSNIQTRRLPALLERIQTGDITGPTRDLLPELQAVLLPLIFCLHKTDKSIDLAQAMNPTLVQILKLVGVFEQSRLSAGVSLLPDSAVPWIVKDSFQRLALLHFKFHMAAHTTIISIFPWTRFSRVVEPSMLNVRAPMPPSFWDNEPAIWSSSPASLGLSASESEDPADDEFLLVSRMYARLCAQPGKRSILLPLFAWDQNFGMAIAGWCDREEGETDIKFIERLRPYVHRPMGIGRLLAPQ